MKTLSLAAALTLAAAVNVSPASATQSPIYGNAAVAAVQQAPAYKVSGIAGPTPHYEWQYHYVGRHARYEGHWVLVR